MKLAFFCYFEPNRISGPSNSVTALAKQLSLDFGHEVVVFTTSPKVRQEFYLNDVLIHPLFHFKNGDSIDCAVLAGLYDFRLIRVVRELVSKKVPYAFSPRSNLMKRSFSKSSLKKKIALASYSGYFLGNAQAIHFLSRSEHENSIPVRSPVFYAGNGVDLFNRPNGDRTNRQILFIGRFDIHHKGLDLLLEAIDLSKKELAEKGWKITLAGPDANGGRAWLLSEIERRDLKQLVYLSEAVTGEKKRVLFEESIFFLHPSRYEGQPQAVIEAMSFGCVPIVTAGTNMGEHVSESKMGWLALDSSKSFAEKIIEAINSEDHTERANRCAIYARTAFTWEKAARDFNEGIVKFIRPHKSAI